MRYLSLIVQVVTLTLEPDGSATQLLILLIEQAEHMTRHGLPLQEA